MSNHPNQFGFKFTGGAGGYLGAAILGFLITAITFGICYPFAFVLIERWRAEGSYIDGRQLRFTGSATGLFGLWIKWFLLLIVTFGIYAFWLVPQLNKWKWENMAFADGGNALPTPDTAPGTDAVPYPAYPAV